VVVVAAADMVVLEVLEKDIAVAEVAVMAADHL
jgi:hypothetical protein